MASSRTSSNSTRSGRGASARGGSGGSRGGGAVRIAASRYGRGGGYTEPGVDPSVQRGRAFLANDLFSWGARNNAEDIEAPRKKFKIPQRAFGPSLATARDSRAGVRERFKNYFAFPRENKVIWREDGNEVARNRRVFLFLVVLLILYTIGQLSR